jgi:hypothetical protein
MLFYVILFFLSAVSTLALLNKFHIHFILEITDRSSATLLLDGGNVGLSDIVTAIFWGRINVRFCQEIDTDTSIPCQVYESANTPHPLDPPIQDWEEVKNAALSSTREMIRHCSGSGEDTPLSLFIQSIILSTLLHLFFQLAITPTNIEEVVWVVGKTWQVEEFVRDPLELCHLIEPSSNPSGIFALLSAIQRLVLAAICTVARRGENTRFLRQAETLLQDPTSPEPDVIRLVEKIKQSHPPVQSVHGRFSLGCLPLRRTYDVGFFIPADSFPLSICIPGPGGVCISWLHKAALPGQPACGGGTWLIHTTAIILSVIETEIRKANLTIDGDAHDPEAWEDWILRRSRVG